MVTRLLGTIAKLLSLTTKLMAALRTVRLSEDCETCAGIVGHAEREYDRVVEELFEKEEK